MKSCNVRCKRNLHIVLSGGKQPKYEMKKNILQFYNHLDLEKRYGGYVRLTVK